MAGKGVSDAHSPNGPDMGHLPDFGKKNAFVRLHFLIPVFWLLAVVHHFESLCHSPAPPDWQVRRIGYLAGVTNL